MVRRRCLAEGVVFCLQLELVRSRVDESGISNVDETRTARSEPCCSERLPSDLASRLRLMEESLSRAREEEKGCIHEIRIIAARGKGHLRNWQFPSRDRVNVKLRAG